MPKMQNRMKKILIICKCVCFGAALLFIPVKVNAMTETTNSDDQMVYYTNSSETWTVPQNSLYEIKLRGGSGGGGKCGWPGCGAGMSGSSGSTQTVYVKLKEGDTYRVIIGSDGGSGSANGSHSDHDRNRGYGGDGGSGYHSGTSGWGPGRGGGGHGCRGSGGGGGSSAFYNTNLGLIEAKGGNGGGVRGSEYGNHNKSAVSGGSGGGSNQLTSYSERFLIITDGIEPSTTSISAKLVITKMAPRFPIQINCEAVDHSDAKVETQNITQATLYEFKSAEICFDTTLMPSNLRGDSWQDLVKFYYKPKNGAFSEYNGACGTMQKMQRNSGTRISLKLEEIPLDLEDAQFYAHYIYKDPEADPATEDDVYEYTSKVLTLKVTPCPNLYGLNYHNENILHIYVDGQEQRSVFIDGDLQHNIFHG